MRSKRFIFITISSFLLGLSLIFVWRYSLLHPSTEDAYVQANIVQITSRVTGPIQKIHVRENEFVKAGAPLFDIEPSVFEANVMAAKAGYEMAVQMMGARGASVGVALSKLEEREVILVKAKRHLSRTESLFEEGLVANAVYEDAQARHAEASAAVSSARADLKRAESEFGKDGNYNARLQQAAALLRLAKLELSFTKIVSPSDGWVSNKNLREGAMVIAEKPQFSIVESENWWVEANFKETDVTHIKVGNSVTIKIDMYPDVTLLGEVESLGAGSGAVFSLLPPENATGNWVKITQRFPVRIKIVDWVGTNSKDRPLRVGSSATVTVVIKP